ncbi:hypothetical protein NS355_09845 [Sphingomonas yabuuchiae]|uniref:Uncharacterized protein n=1 Tax=Sphingomonas yabuuchiae TaxID=172044 RepID=A0A147IRW9_9SPHN|nr:hypothetical protein NS355_09845 [Sphingomonas yabuuchiae]
MTAFWTAEAQRALVQGTLLQRAQTPPDMIVIGPCPAFLAAPFTTLICHDPVPFRLSIRFRNALTRLRNQRNI